MASLLKHRPIGVRCYDNGGKTFDQYTVVYTGRYRRLTGGEQWYRGMSTYPCHPQGFGQSGTSRRDIDRPTYGHLGRKISFDALPEDCQRLVIQDAMYLGIDDEDWAKGLKVRA